MKKITTIYLDEQLINKLKETNTSALIEKLLKNFFLSGDDLKEKDLEQNVITLKKEIAEKELELKQTLEALEIIKKKKEQMREVFRDLPNEILEDFRSFPSLTEQSLLNRYKNLYFKYNITYEQVLNAFKEYQKMKGGE